MKYFKLNILACILIILSSCNSKKEVVSQKEDSRQVEVNLEKESFKSGIVSYNENSECAYIIIDLKSNLKYDPINFNNEKFANFRVDKNEVYFKFIPLRRMNRCENVQPIELTELIEK